ncbi:ABC transporter substrate-binding protein [Mycolicibacterium sp. CH28]|uniref:ABC transporter substrate-binding protein n=1 Tax=Mycolicibacterium sp. CH28 TaxID=2512237 RepID=UPI0035163490
MTDVQPAYPNGGLGGEPSVGGASKTGLQVTSLSNIVDTHGDRRLPFAHDPQEEAWMVNGCLQRNVLRGFLSAVVVALSVTACSSASDSNAPPSGSADSLLRAMLPASVRDSGKLRVATDASYPPMEFMRSDRQKVIGFDADLGQELGDALGVDMQFVNTSFDGIIAGLQSKRFDLAMSAITDKPSRREQVDFVDYLNVGSSLMVAKGNPEKLTELAQLCGRRAAVEQGTSAADTAQQQSAKCAADGKPAVEVLTFPDQNGANLALQSGRVDAVLANYPTLAYLVKQNPDGFEITGEQFNLAPYGIAIAKDQTQLRDAIRAALQKLIDSGKYVEIVDKWNLGEAGVKSVAVNGAPG